jgi:hypothetical protein
VTFVYATKYNLPLRKYVPLFLCDIIHEVVDKVLAQAVYLVQIFYSFNYLGFTGYFYQKIKNMQINLWFKSVKIIENIINMVHFTTMASAMVF